MWRWPKHQARSYSRQRVAYVAMAEAKVPLSGESSYKDAATKTQLQRRSYKDELRRRDYNVLCRIRINKSFIAGPAEACSVNDLPHGPIRVPTSIEHTRVHGMQGLLDPTSLLSATQFPLDQLWQVWQAKQFVQTNKVCFDLTCPHQMDTR